MIFLLYLEKNQQKFFNSQLLFIKFLGKSFNSYKCIFHLWNLKMEKIIKILFPVVNSVMLQLIWMFSSILLYHLQELHQFQSKNTFTMYE
jgi:peptidoglycan/LPS O-acetylase OafA/YrhL